MKNSTMIVILILLFSFVLGATYIFFGTEKFSDKKWTIQVTYDIGYGQETLWADSLKADSLDVILYIDGKPKIVKGSSITIFSNYGEKENFQEHEERVKRERENNLSP